MAIPIIGDLIDKVGGLISEVVVDKDKRDQVNLELERLRDDAQARLDAMVAGQIEVNKVEAASGSVFVAGWRPFVGWVGGFALGYSAILYPFLSFGARLFGYHGELPEIDNSLILTVLMGMLGIGGMRTFEKVKGVSTNNYTDVPKSIITTQSTSKEKTQSNDDNNKKKHFHIF